MSKFLLGRLFQAVSTAIEKALSSNFSRVQGTS